MFLFEKYAEGDEALAIEYFRFLTLKWIVRDRDNQRIVASKKIDEIWRRHVLDTKAYKRDCMAYFNLFLNYSEWTDVTQKEQAYETTLEKYNGHYDMDPPELYWPRRTTVNAATEEVLEENTVMTRNASKRLRAEPETEPKHVIVKVTNLNHPNELYVKAKPTLLVHRLVEVAVRKYAAITGEAEHVFRPLINFQRPILTETLEECYEDLDKAELLLTYEQRGC